MATWIFVAALVARNIIEPFLAFGKAHQPPRPRFGTGLGTLFGMIVAFAVAGIATGVYLYLDGGRITGSFLIGILLLIAGYLGRIVSVRQLGHGYSQTFSCASGAPLVTTGVYYMIRHPIYACFVLEALGLWVIRPNHVSAIAFLSILGICLYRIAQEEVQLRQRFGDQYRHYASHTKIMIPFVF